MKPRLYLLLGLPGAGKTTAAKLLAEQTGAHYLSSDDTRRKLFPRSQFTRAEHDELYRKLDAAVIYLLEQGKSVVYDANLNRYIHRKEKYALAKKLSAEPVLVWVKTPHELARKRRVHQEPQHDLTPRHETPGAMFDRIADVFEAPKNNENAHRIEGVDITKEKIQKLLREL